MTQPFERPIGVPMNISVSDDLVVTARDGAVLRLTMNRAAARNALNGAMMRALQTAFESAADDNSLVIVLAAEGSAFCAGHDLKEMTSLRAEPDHGRAAFAAIFEQCSKLMKTIVRHPKPVIAQVQGIATAAGCQLVASCDLALVSQAARFATPGVNIGLFCSTPMFALSRNVSRKHAMQMLLTGDLISAEDAPRIWLVTHDVPAGQERGAALQLAETNGAKST